MAVTEHANSLALASGTMFNRNGDLVCTVSQEMYFPPFRSERSGQ